MYIAVLQVPFLAGMSLIYVGFLRELARAQRTARRRWRAASCCWSCNCNRLKMAPSKMPYKTSISMPYCGVCVIIAPLFSPTVQCSAQSQGNVLVLSCTVNGEPYNGLIHYTTGNETVTTASPSQSTLLPLFREVLTTFCSQPV